MKQGVYPPKMQASKLLDYRAPYFKPQEKPGYHHGMRGTCGTNALGLITGIGLQRIERARPRRPGTPYWSVTAALRFLHRRGIRTIPLTHNVVTNRESYQTVVTPDHVILAETDQTTTETSFVVIFQGKLWHNFASEEATAYSLLNYPIVQAWILYRPEWKIVPPKTARQQKLDRWVICAW